MARQRQDVWGKHCGVRVVARLPRPRCQHKKSAPLQKLGVRGWGVGFLPPRYISPFSTIITLSPSLSCQLLSCFQACAFTSSRRHPTIPHVLHPSCHWSLFSYYRDYLSSVHKTDLRLVDNNIWNNTPFFRLDPEEAGTYCFAGQ